jgi:protein ImuB
MAPVPDDPPLSFRWRHQQHRVARAEGPERIAAEWWRAPPGTPARDYYWVEDTAGRRYWLFRDGPYASGQPARWYLHGLFA